MCNSSLTCNTPTLQPGSPLPACIHVYGDSGSGKSTVLETVLACLSVKTCAANCVEMWSQQLLFQTAINSFADHVPASHNGYGAYSTCESLGEFVRQLQELGRRPGHEGDRLALVGVLGVDWLVLYQCERLRDGDLFSLSALCRLQELCGGTVNICILLVSVLAIDKLLPSGGIAMPFVVHFPQYSKEELIELLLRERCPEEESEGFSEDFHRTYVTLVLSVFYPASRSQSEMRHLALRQKEPALVNRKGVLFLHDNARPHAAPVVRDTIQQLEWETLCHPLYSSGLAPSDYHLFHSLDNHLRRKSFTNEADLRQALTDFFASKTPEFYRKGIEQLETRWQKLSVHWKTYLGPVERGEVPAQQLRSDHLRTLWRNIEPHLRRALNTLYVKEVNR
ncbi:Origin recognition complex subunit 5 [Trinorchestia longiramus]|nr:Origin recognition complex subunit 5 [Trinorchestia longiramus]